MNYTKMEFVAEENRIRVYVDGKEVLPPEGSPGSKYVLFLPEGLRADLLEKGIPLRWEPESVAKKPEECWATKLAAFKESLPGKTFEELLKELNILQATSSGMFLGVRITYVKDELRSRVNAVLD